jgi:molecular chaperone GrpE
MRIYGTSIYGEVFFLRLPSAFFSAIAETENLRRRSQKQIEDTKVFAIQSFCKDLLEVADILNLAIDSVDKSHVNSNPSMKSLFDGVTMTKEVLLNTFNRHGLVVISPEGERFDPNLHEAVFQVSKEHVSQLLLFFYSVPFQSKHAPDHIDQVLKIGYSLHGRPVRAAKVGVVKE